MTKFASLSHRLSAIFHNPDNQQLDPSTAIRSELDQISFSHIGTVSRKEYQQVIFKIRQKLTTDQLTSSDTKPLLEAFIKAVNRVQQTVAKRIKLRQDKDKHSSLSDKNKENVESSIGQSVYRQFIYDLTNNLSISESTFEFLSNITECMTDNFMEKKATDDLPTDISKNTLEHTKNTLLIDMLSIKMNLISFVETVKAQTQQEQINTITPPSR